MMIFLLPIWLIREIKAILFWLYFWQLKEYHLGRVISHLGTSSGKTLLFNKANLTKTTALLVFFIFSFFYGYKHYFSNFIWLPFFILLYSVETIKVINGFIKKSLKIPAITAKTVFLLTISLGFFLFASISSWFLFVILFSVNLSIKVLDIYIAWLLILDILTPLFISGIVILLQPLTVCWRRSVIARAKAKRQKLTNLVVVGITGSYGKTSTKEFLATILAEKFRVLKTKEHQNSEIGIAQCILNDLKPEHQVFVAEMGAYGKGWIKLLCDLTKPKIGIIAGVNEQHLALFGSMENLMSAEGGEELIESLPKDGAIVVNWDNPILVQSVKRKAQSDSAKFKTLRYSVLDKENADIWAENIVTEKDCVRFTAITKEGETADFKVNVLGTHNVLNLLGATLVAKWLGMTFEEIARAAGKIKQEQGPMKIFRSPALERTIIDSTYSANPDGVLADLEYLKTWPGRKVIIMPCLIELGPAAKEAHQKIGKKIAEVCDLAIITTRDWFEKLKSSATAAGMKPENIIFSENAQEILEKMSRLSGVSKSKNYSGPEDVILLEGRPSEQLKKRIFGI